MFKQFPSSSTNGMRFRAILKQRLAYELTLVNVVVSISLLNCMQGYLLNQDLEKTKSFEMSRWACLDVFQIGIQVGHFLCYTYTCQYRYR